MTPNARISAAIDILDLVLGGMPAEAALLRWSRSSRFAGSGDRNAVRDLVFDGMRRLRSRAALGGSLSGRGVMLGMCRETGADPVNVFTGEGHAPPPLTAAELAAGQVPEGLEALDLPDGVWPLWQQSLGHRAEDVARAMQDRAPVWLRVNALKSDPQKAIVALQAEGITCQPHPELPAALMVTDGARKIAASTAYRDGLIELQDLSPQLACAALPAAKRALDYCAGGGGKALALAASGVGSVVAHDASAARMTDLTQRAHRAGARIQIAAPGSVKGSFDLVLVDVPCSGSGTWRRTPDAKWRFSMPAFHNLLQTQKDILDEVVPHVAPKGHLAYMTCSVLTPENGDQIAAFLTRHPDFEQDFQRSFLPPEASDGFFMAVLRRR